MLSTIISSALIIGYCFATSRNSCEGRSAVSNLKLRTLQGLEPDPAIQSTCFLRASSQLSMSAKKGFSGI